MSDDYYETIEDTGELSDNEQDNNVAASVVDNHPEYDARFISNFTNLISESATPFEAYTAVRTQAARYRTLLVMQDT